MTSHFLRRLRVQAHFIPSSWVWQIAGLIALIAYLADEASNYPGAFQ